MKMIVGLGNPGKEYVNTRHNVGFYMVDKFVNDYKIEKTTTIFDSKCHYLWINGKKVIFVEPQTYMNLSGIAVQNLFSYFKLSLLDLLITYDDKDLPIGTLKIKNQGSSAGHNGIKNIAAMLGTEKINRLKIGIGNNKNIVLHKWVLGKFSLLEQSTLEKLYNAKVKFIFEQWINDFSVDKLMTIYNAKEEKNNASAV